MFLLFFSLFTMYILWIQDILANELKQRFLLHFLSFTEAASVYHIEKLRCVIEIVFVSCSELSQGYWSQLQKQANKGFSENLLFSLKCV